MRNLRKVIAVIVSLVMLLGVAAISASAEGEKPTISLYGKSEIGLTEQGGTELYELAVYLDEAGSAVGAVEGTITYDTGVFDYDSIVSNLDTTTNPEGTVFDIDEENGAIRFIALVSDTRELFVVNFAVVGENEDATFILTTKIANQTGTDYLNVKAARRNVAVKDNDIINVNGAAILKTASDKGTQDIRFNIQVDDTLAAAAITEANPAVEVGVLMMFTKRLGYNELTVDMIDDENVTGLVVAKKTLAEGEDVASFTANVRNMQSNALGVRVSARAYIKLEDETVIYSRNFNSQMETNCGYASESVIGVAIDAINEGDCGEVPENIAEIIAKTSISTIEREELMKFIYENYVG